MRGLDALSFEPVFWAESKQCLGQLLGAPGAVCARVVRWGVGCVCSLSMKIVEDL